MKFKFEQNKPTLSRYINAGKKFLRGDWNKKSYYLRKMTDKLFFKAFFEEKKFKNRLSSYLKKIADSDSDSVILMFSGTSFIENYEGNRPIRLTKEFLKREIPVLFSYWRWNKSDKMPNEVNNLLFQSPIDFTLKYIDIIINFNFQEKSKIFIASFPHSSCVELLGLLKAQGWVVIYDVRDDWEEFKNVGQAVWYEKQVEEYLVKHSDVVCAVSKPLVNKIQTLTNNKKILLNPNALDSDFVLNPPANLAPRSGEMIIGYIGHLTDAWFDWDSIIYIANNKPNWIFEIIGHSLPHNITLPDNIRYLGARSHKELINLTKDWRVAIIPFKISKLADAVDPIKVYEYLALGIPVVSFRMPQIENYPYVFMAYNKAEFMQKIEEAAILEINEDVVKDFLLSNSWARRAQDFYLWGTITK